MKARIGHWTRSQTDMVGAGLWRNHPGSQCERGGAARREGRRAVKHCESGCACVLEADCPSWNPSSALY